MPERCPTARQDILGPVSKDDFSNRGPSLSPGEVRPAMPTQITTIAASSATITILMCVVLSAFVSEVLMVCSFGSAI